MNTIYKQAVWLAFNIYFEARGESEEGKIAVGHVTMNRVQFRDKSVKDVILQPWQFSWTNENDPQEKKIDVMNERSVQAFEECLDAAYKCLGERLEGKDLFKADHYYNPKGVKRTPAWADAYRHVCRVGSHLFFTSK